MVTLNVQSVKNKTAGTATIERILHLKKENNTFGFSINEDDINSGYFIKMLAENGPAAKEGINVGDRILEINKEPVEGNSSHFLEILYVLSIQTCPLKTLLGKSRVPKICLLQFYRKNEKMAIKKYREKEKVSLTREI
jgi:hypothetical protein